MPSWSKSRRGYQAGEGAGARDEREGGSGEIFLLSSIPSGVYRKDGARLFLEVHRDRTRGKRHNCNREIPVRYEENFFQEAPANPVRLLPT